MTDYRNVKLSGGFWKRKSEMNRRTTIEAVYDRFYETGRIEAFRFGWKEGMPNQPHFFWDSDVAKWMEGAAYILAKEDNPALRAKVESIIDDIIANQGEDGYFNIFFTVVAPEKRWSDRNCHELYCAGHLMEAACAYYEATGEDRFLKAMMKYADYIEKVFVKEDSAAFTTPGHEEIELALYKMYQTTGMEKYLRLSEFFINKRGANDKDTPILDPNRYAQNHLPVREQHEAFGHSVRAVYLYSGMADIAAETGDKALADACRDLFDDMTERKMYITGGLGSTYIGEAFTIPYDLPNDRAYAETCASIGMIFFASRMLKLEHKAKYADVIELELYNGALSGVSLSGDAFFYENPLEINMDDRIKITSSNHGERYPITQRQKIFGCSCCPPNINRLLASVENYFYTPCEGGVYIDQFAESTFTEGDTSVTVHTDYPTTGKIEIEANCPVYVRIPGWCTSFTASSPYTMTENGYAAFEAGNITVELDMSPVLLQSNVRVYKNIGKAAMRRGPVIYCAEAKDNDGDVHTLYFDASAVSETAAVYDDFFGVPVLTAKGFRRRNPEDGKLYYPLNECFEETEIRLIPYFGFANRGESNMLVFLNYR
ncbi:MAG: glycoside hydrolase family 127 protein [Eubacteriales bacterium]